MAAAQASGEDPEIATGEAPAPKTTTKAARAAERGTT
jgi:hypothetical protein